MKLGIVLTPGEAGVTGNFVSRMAADAEAAGLDSVWFFDSVGRGWLAIDPLSAVAAAAAVTEQIEVGTSILQLPIRHPVELANRVLTTHLLCEGRFTLGVGAGSTKIDYEVVGIPFEERMSRFDQSLVIMRALLHGETVGSANLQVPQSAIGGPPVLIGSWAGATWIPRAAREFDGWMASAFYADADTLKQGIESFRGAGGKRAVVTNISLDLSADAGADGPGKFNLMCGPGEAARRLQSLAELGFDDAIVVHRGEGYPDFAAIRALLPS